jgi:hypothetical protein
VTKLQREKLEELANYILPAFTIPTGGKDITYVPLENAKYMRQLARDVLALEKK